MSVRSPASGVELKSLTLYANKILFKSEIPKSQTPVVFKLDIDKILSGDEEKEPICIFDHEIRNLLEKYLDSKKSEEKKKIFEDIHERRLSLGLSVQEIKIFRTLDLSHLDLSKMRLKGLSQKGFRFVETDFSESILNNCCFERCRFFKCNMQSAFFVNCNFLGEEVSFSKTDVKDVVIEENCYLEKGSTWARITNWSDFKEELTARGAMNVDSVVLRSLRSPDLKSLLHYSWTS